jgi:DNA (cytosine-5)-methyltransferase 1
LIFLKNFLFLIQKCKEYGIIPMRLLFKGKVMVDQMKQCSIYEYLNKQSLDNDKIKFIDLFAGIGGFRIGFERANCQCVFSSEINEHACKMYELNYGDDPFCDITKLDPNTIPDFDILCAGFPCQAFSICGKQLGFEDETRGTLFFDICRILSVKHPKVFMLENVFNLEKHDKGRTLQVMLDTLNSLGYHVDYKVFNAREFGVPQNRDRIIIVGNNLGLKFDFSKVKKNTVDSMLPYLDTEGNFDYLDKSEYTLLPEDKIKCQQKSGLIFCGYRNKKLRTSGVRPGTEFLSRVHKQPNRIYDARGIHPTLASQESSGRYFIKVNDKVRKLTINECYRFMGFPKDFKFCGGLSQLYARIGNSVCVNMVEAIAKEIINQFFGGQNA